MFCCFSVERSTDSGQNFVASPGSSPFRCAPNLFSCKRNGTEGEGGRRRTIADRLRKWFARMRSEPVTVADGRNLPENRNTNEVTKQEKRKLKTDYKRGKKLGRGSFGTVYAGTRRSDGLQVALKFVRKTEKTSYVLMLDAEHPVPLEVALLMRANEEPKVPEIITFIDWYEERSQYIVVTERPENCENLLRCVERYGGCIAEAAARHFMRQVVRASTACTDRGVLHRDIKLTNLLLNNRSMEVKLIDFGSGDFLSPAPYTLFSGTPRFCPPEFFRTGTYKGEEATVWSLGVLLYRMVHGYYPTKTDYSWPSEELSKECGQLISLCLQQNPKYRIKLDDILQHKWFQCPPED